MKQKISRTLSEIQNEKNLKIIYYFIAEIAEKEKITKKEQKT